MTMTTERLIVRTDSGKYVVVHVDEEYWTVAVDPRHAYAWIATWFRVQRSRGEAGMREITTHRWAVSYRTLTEAVATDDGHLPMRRAPEHDHPRPALRRQRREERRRLLLKIG
jgi:hypothetical protein